MKRHIANMSLAALLCLPVICRGEVLVFTDRNHPVSAPEGVTVAYLDEAEQMLDELSAKLPANAAEAASIAEMEVKNPEFIERIRQAYTPVVLAWQLGIKKVPAVVVDAKYVVYGHTDVTAALAKIEAYREQREEQ